MISYHINMSVTVCRVNWGVRSLLYFFRYVTQHSLIIVFHKKEITLLDCWVKYRMHLLFLRQRKEIQSRSRIDRSNRSPKCQQRRRKEKEINNAIAMFSEMTEVYIPSVERRKEVNCSDILKRIINQLFIFLSLVESS